MAEANITSPKVTEAVSKINAHIDALSAQFVARRALLELIVLGMISREHVLLIGPPGTGKSAAVQSVASAIEAVTFDYLLGRFTEPSELFGALDLNALKDGRIEPVTHGMLPQAEIAFLDEIFLGSTAILNTLLKILNERTYRRGQFSMKAPLISCIAASNAMPEDSQLAAFADRFLLTMFVDPVEEHQLPELLESGWQQSGETSISIPPLAKGVVHDLHIAALNIDLAPVRETFAHFIRKLRMIGVVISDRKAVKAQKLVASAALLRGDTVASVQDLWPITYLVQDKAQQVEVGELLATELKESMNPVLRESVAKATYGPTAHASHLNHKITQLLDARPANTGDPSYEIWLVRLETLMTEIDAAFSAESLSEQMRTLRSSMQGILDASVGGSAVDAVAAH
jgi:MoxR-like ATPase